MKSEVFMEMFNEKTMNYFPYLRTVLRTVTLRSQPVPAIQ